MEILEHKAAWADHFRRHWLAHLEQTGEVDWRRYRHPQNRRAPGAPGVSLPHSRLLLVTSSGAYRPDHQPPFDAASQMGDYTMRTFASDTPFGALAYAHDHYDHHLVEADPQTALPLTHLADLAAAGEIGSLAPTVVSFMGYQPDSARVVDTLAPQVVAHALAEGADAALLAPV